MNTQLPQLKALEKRLEKLSEEIGSLRSNNDETGGTDPLSDEVKSRVEKKIRKLLDMLDAF